MQRIVLSGSQPASGPGYDAVASKPEEHPFGLLIPPQSARPPRATTIRSVVCFGRG
jgi:hypothetical protein